MACTVSFPTAAADGGRFMTPTMVRSPAVSFGQARCAVRPGVRLTAAFGGTGQRESHVRHGAPIPGAQRPPARATAHAGRPPALPETVTTRLPAAPDPAETTSPPGGPANADGRPQVAGYEILGELGR